MNNLYIENFYDVIVIGGGPAGLLCAGTSGSKNKKTLLLEKNSTCGKKLLITGKGSCNVTNNLPVNLFLDGFFENKKFLNSAIRQFSPEDLIEFFSILDVSFKTINNFKIFPDSLSSSTILDALIRYCGENNVFIKTNSNVVEIYKETFDNSRIFYVKTNDYTYKAKSLVIATGGLSYPITGSTGDGYLFANKFGHTIVNLRPALVGVKSMPKSYYKELSGISLKNITVSLFNENLSGGESKVKSVTDDLLFTHDGVSGPSIFYLSRYLPEDVDKGISKSSNSCYYFSFDLLPHINENELESKLIEIIASSPKRKITNIISKEFELPLSFCNLLVTYLNLSNEILAADITKEIRKKLKYSLKNFKSNIDSTLGYERSTITAGGVSLKEINPKTMESKKIENLYFVGEVLNIDGNTGGFNLQAAFSTGYVAGLNA